MIGDLAYALAFLGFGAFLALHCSREARREFQSGIARSEFAEHRRSAEPAAFWFIIAATALAAVLGFLFMAIGFVTLLGVAR